MTSTLPVKLLIYSNSHYQVRITHYVPFANYLQLRVIMIYLFKTKTNVSFFVGKPGDQYFPLYNLENFSQKSQTLVGKVDD